MRQRSFVVALALAMLCGRVSHPADEAAKAIAAAVHGIVADYNSELRKPDGRVDIEAMVARLRALHVNTYFWLVWHAPTDWDDLKLFLPLAAKAEINVWVYLVPPSESPPRFKWYSEPFRLDYVRWAEEIAKLSLQHPNLTAWVIDDFYGNRRFYTPQYVRKMQDAAKRVNPRLPFLPLMYYPQIARGFVDAYREVIDGVVVAYPRDAAELEGGWAVLNDAARVAPGQLSYPWARSSKAGDFVAVTQAATVVPADRCIVRFDEQEDFVAATAGYHVKQLLVDGAVAWEEDVAGGAAGWRPVSVDITKHVRGKRAVKLAFRLFDRKGVFNFGVRWALRGLEADGLRLAADLAQPAEWQVAQRGVFRAGFGDAVKAKETPRQFHIPTIVMTAASLASFRKRHGNPATPERLAEWVRMCLQAWHDGKCDGVVTYCLDKGERSPTFPLVSKLYQEFRAKSETR